MIGTGIDVRVKIQDIVSSQLPEFILSEAPLTDDFLKQFYVSQEFQGGTMDFAANLDQYINLNNLTDTTISGKFFLTEPLSETDTTIHVNTTKSFPNEWGLLKVGDEIITYTGVTTNTFTGAVRGFSGITSYHAEDNPGNLVFQTTSAASHADEASVQNLSTLFLKEFYNKIKFTFAPGFENLDFDSEVNVGTWISQARSFYQSKGSAESIEILFRVLYGEDPTVIDLEQFLIKSSEAEYSRRDFAVGIPVEGNPRNLQGRTVFQDNSQDVFGAVSEIEPFLRDGQLYYKIFFFVANDEIGDERKLFTVPGLTKAHRGWKQGDTTLTVDSTIGFRDNNTFITSDGTVFTYEDRTVNQFLGVTCEDPEKEILIDDEIIDDIKVVGTDREGNTVSLRLTGVLSDISFDEEVPFATVGEKIRVDSLGENILAPIADREDQTYADIVANSFIYNTSVRFEVENVSGVIFTLKAPYLDKSSIRVGDFVDILPRGSQQAYVTGRLVTNVDFTNSTVTVNDSFGVPTNAEIDIRRNQKYATSANAPIDYGNDAVLSNVLNLYDATEYDSNFYVATNSLPSYEMDVKVVESTITGISTLNFEDYNSFTNTYSTVIFDSAVEFISGDLIAYSVQPGIGTTAIYPICPEGEYFVEVLNNPRKIRLYLSPSFIGSTNFVELTANTEAGTHIFTLESQKNRDIETQKTYRTIPITGDRQNIAIDRPPSRVEPGKIAVLTNGVEVVSYLAADKVYLGPVISVDPVAKGEGYSVTQPPVLTVSEPDLQLQDPVVITPDSTARLTPVIKGKLEKILIDPQNFDISKTFRITVTGGNSRGAAAIPQIEKKNRQIPFDSRLEIFGGGVNPNQESILFLTDHNLPKGEPIVYNNRGTSSIGVSPAGGSNTSLGNRLSDGGIYYADPLNNRTIQLYNNIDDLNAGINTVGFTSNLTGYGIQSFDTLAKNTIVGATIIEDGGDFWYRSLHAQPENVFVEYDEIRYTHHGFSTGEVVEYVAEGTPIAGLSTSDSYYVVSEDKDTFKLCNAGVGATSTFNYDRLEFVNLEGVGVGTHIFKYPDIKVNVTVSFASTITGIVTATPVVRGEIAQVYVDNGGYYGSDILNFEKSPNITISKGTGARIKPIVIDGKVVTVQILSTGTNYPDTPILQVEDSSGSGQGALLRAIVENGSIVDVVVIEEGISYGEFTTDIEVIDPSKDAILSPAIRALDVNLQERFGFESLIDNSYGIVSYERTIRENVYNDLGNLHSPIVGWSNDGNPIYGGFGYSDAEDPNSDILALASGYVLDPAAVPGRPSLSTYPAGFFTQDYKYTGEGDLDQYNGRYCRTPEFPNGVYAYFATISTDAQSLERLPQFPYFIGPEFRDAPISTADIDQSFNINDKPIYRNTFPYYVGSPVAGSEFLVQSYLDSVQESVIQSINVGEVDSITIVGEGVDYKVGDIPVFDNSEDVISSVVTEVTGKEIVSIGSSITAYSKSVTKLIRIDNNNVRVYVDPSHDYLDSDIVVFSGLSTNTTNLAGPQRISVDNSQMVLAEQLDGTLIEDTADIFVNSITENVSIGSLIVIDNGTTSETVTVIDIFRDNRALRIDRPTAYADPATAGSVVTVVPNYLDVRAKTNDFTSELDVDYYFNPQQTVGGGLVLDDIGNSVARTYEIGKTQFEISVPVGAIYAPSHEFRNNEPIIFGRVDNLNGIGYLDPNNGGSGTLPSPIIGINTGLFYIANLGKDIIGIRTEAGALPLMLSDSGSDSNLYRVETLRFAETVSLDRIEAIVDTANPHELKSGDLVDVTVLSKRSSGVGSNPTIKVEFDSISQSLIVDPQFASPSEVDLANNIITIPNHNYVLGDYVLYENNNVPIVGLQTHQKYFVIPFDVDNFRLAKTFEDIKPGSELPIDLSTVGIGSHKFSRVNPKLDIVVENNAEFDVSSPSLVDTELRFFYDEELTEVFESNGIDDDFVVIGVSTEGLPGAKKVVNFSKNNPSVIYYGLEISGYISTADTNAQLNNSIQYVDSTFSDRKNATVLSPTRFIYSLFARPEIPSYDPLESILKYNTASATAIGGVGAVRIISSGRNFTSLPEFVTIDSVSGKTATLRAESENIGTLSSFRIKNPGWGYSADNTLRPQGNVQSKVEFSNSDFVTSIDITFAGQGYQNAPNGVLLDAVTREVIDSGSIVLEVQSSSISGVVVELPPTGLTKNPHELYTINNSNGIPILTVDGIDRTTGIVSFTIQTPIDGYSEPPFETGDEVFIENIISTNPLVSANMDSTEYGYQFFEVLSASVTNPIKVVVQYPQETAANIGIAQTFQGAFSSIVNKKLYPTFNVNQSTAIFTTGERLSIFDEQGNLIETDLVVEESNTNFFKFRGNYDVLVGDRLKGNVSGVIVTVTSITNNSCRYTVSSISRIANGWSNTTGFLNDELQVTPDNDYYQNLSYSIKSDEFFDTWIGPVNRLVHPSGLKNFADTTIQGVGKVGAGFTADTGESITLDFLGLTDVAGTPLRVDRINSFDLGYDDEINNNRSNAIRFNSRTPNKRLTDYLEVKTNRVLMIDDISNQFIDSDNVRGQKEYSEFDVISSSYTRGILFVRNPFTDQAELTEVVSLTYNNDAYTLQKATVSDNNQGYGNFDAIALQSTEYSLRYTPFDTETFDIDYKLLTHKFVGGSEPSLKLGYNLLTGQNYTVNPGQKINIGASNNAIVLYIQLTDQAGNPSYFEVYAFLMDNNQVRIGTYGFDSTRYENYNEDLLGQFEARRSGATVVVEFTNNDTAAVLLEVREIDYQNNTNSNDVYRFKPPSLAPGQESSINLINSRSTGTAGAVIDLLTVDVSKIQAIRSVYHISSPTFSALHQVMSINSSGSTYTNEYPFLSEGIGAATVAGVGSFGADIVGSDWTLKFYPDPGYGIVPVEITGYHEAFYRKYDEINYRNIPLLYTINEENYFLERYIAPLGQRTNVTQFELTYEGTPIFEKSFNPSETIVAPPGSSDRSIFNLADHFFSPLEELYYEPGSTVDGAPVAAIGIQTTVDYTGLTTDKMPSKVYAIKRDLNRFQLGVTPQAIANEEFIIVTDNGAGNAHKIGMEKKLEKSLITIDGVVQAPIASSNKEYVLDENINESDTLLTLTGIGTLRAGDIFLLNEEYVIIDNVGFSTSPNGPIGNVGTVPLIEVKRGSVGTIATSHTVGAAMTLHRGSYNIVSSDVFFTEAPSGRGEFSLNESNIVEINSTFQGRVFLQKEYDQIRVYDDISDQFNGQDATFTLTSLGATTGIGTTGGPIENGSGILIINDIYQTPTTDNNEGNNYFYDYDVNTGINSVTFTGVTSANGSRVDSEFDVNQNQIPRGGLIVSLGSTPGLGYAPLVPAIITPDVSGGAIVGVNTTNIIGATAPVRYADYNNLTGDLKVSVVGVSTGIAYSVADATYFNEAGTMLVDLTVTIAAAGLNVGDVVVLNGLGFLCPQGTEFYPDKDDVYVIQTITGNNQFAIEVGISTIAHTYVSGGTVQKHVPFDFGGDDNPTFAYLNGLEFACPSGQTVGLTTTIFPVNNDFFPVYEINDIAHYTLQVGISTLIHEYVGGGSIGQYTINQAGSGYNRQVGIAVTEVGHVGTAASIIGIPGDGGELEFVVVNPGTGYTSPQLFAPDPDYANLPIRGVSRRDGTSETGRNLFVTCEVGAAKTTAIGKSEYFEVSNFEITNQGYSFLEGDVVEVVGLVTAKGLAQPLEPFQLTIEKIFTDNFASWNFGELDYIDSIADLQDGVRTRFPLLYKGELFSFEQNRQDEDSAAIDMNAILLIYVNTVLQQPILNYTFEGGTSFEFTSAPLPEDDIDVYFYRGKRGIDSDTVTDVNESIRPGDVLQVRKNDSYNPSKTQDLRTVTEIASSDTVRTNIYFGNNDLDAINPREVAWEKQKRDKFIYGEIAPKTRDSIEPIIRPNPAILLPVPTGSAPTTRISVDSIDALEYEATVAVPLNNIKGTIFAPAEYRPAVLEARVNAQGQVFEIDIIDGGAGYINNSFYSMPRPGTPGYYDPQNTIIMIAPPPGYSESDIPPTPGDPARAFVTNARVSNGAIDDITINVFTGFGGAGYDPANPPAVIVSQPPRQTENLLSIPSANGFAGKITSIQEVPIPGSLQGIEFGVEVFERYELTEISELGQGDAIVISQTVVGPGAVESRATTSGDPICIGGDYLDCVYVVRSTSFVGRNGTVVVTVDRDVDLTGIAISGDEIGYLTWGRLNDVKRNLPGEGSFAFPIPNPQYTDDMENFPTLLRTNEGLRNNGGLGKRL